MSLFFRLFQFVVKYIVSLILLLYAGTFGILNKKGRQFLVILLDYYNLTVITKTIPTKLPKISFDNVISNTNIEVIEPVEKDGNVDLHELVIINGIIWKENPRRIFEIGTFDGRTTINMANSSQENCEVFTLDLPNSGIDSTKFVIGEYDKTLVNKEESGERVRKSGLPCKNKIRQLYGDSAKFDFSPYYNSVGLVFIDGAHDYENVLADSLNALKLIGEQNGVILWHDYKHSVPVVSAIETLRIMQPQLQIYHISGTNMAYCKVR